MLSSALTLKRQPRQQVSRLVGSVVCVKKQNRGLLVIFTKSLIVNIMSKTELNEGRGGIVNETLKSSIFSRTAKVIHT